MIRRPEHVTVVIPSEEEGKELSVRYALRCIFRDVRMLFRASAGHARHYFGTIRRGHRHATCWWTRSQHPGTRK